MNPISESLMPQHPTENKKAEKESQYKFGDKFVKIKDAIPTDVLRKANNAVEKSIPDFNRIAEGYPLSIKGGWHYANYTELKSAQFSNLSLRIPVHHPPFYFIGLVDNINGLCLDDSCEITNKESVVNALRQNVKTDADAVIDLLFSGIRKMAVESQLGGSTININQAYIARFPVTKELTSDETKHLWEDHHDSQNPDKSNIILTVTMNEKINDAGCGYEGGEIITACKSEKGSELQPVDGSMEPHDVSVKNSAILQTGDRNLIVRTNNTRLVGAGNLAEKRQLVIWITVNNDQEIPDINSLSISDSEKS